MVAAYSLLPFDGADEGQIAILGRAPGKRTGRAKPSEARWAVEGGLTIILTGEEVW